MALLIREIGSFHVGGRMVRLEGLPPRARVSTPGGPVHPIDPNGEIMVGQMYVQYVRLAAPLCARAAADVARRRHDGSQLGDDARRAAGLADVLPARGLRHLCLGCGRARPRVLGAISRSLSGGAIFPNRPRKPGRRPSASARGLLASRSARRRTHAGLRFPALRRSIRSSANACRAGAATTP